MAEDLRSIATRKSDHIDIVLKDDVGFGRLTAGFDAVRFVHNALPEIDLAEVDLSTRFLGRRLNAPFLISSMTGGPARAESVNRHLAEGANHLGIGLAVGSQRIALEEQGSGGMTRSLRRAAPDIPLMGNIGAAQIIEPAGVDRVRRALEMIEADAIFVHLNPLQEAVQAGGDTAWRGVLGAIEGLVRAGLPVAIKEVGFGLSRDVVRRLHDAGVEIIDVAGAGGTNWARVEGERHEGPVSAVAAEFTEWGVPTARALIDARVTAPDAVLIGSGGIASGLDAAKALRIGADIVGQAASVLGPALSGPDAVVDHFERILTTLRIVCFVTGSRTIPALKTAPLAEEPAPTGQ